MFTDEKTAQAIKSAREEELKNYVLSEDSTLEADVTSRLYGTATQIGVGYRKVGYNILRKFFDGDQWAYTKESGGTVRVFNYCQPTVYNYTAFLAAEAPEIDIPAEDITDETEVALSEEKERLLRDIMRDNQFPIVFEEAVQNGSLLGDSMIIGPFWDRDTKRIWFENVKRPEQIRIIWSNTSYTEMRGFILHYTMNLKYAEKVFAEQMRARGIKTLRSPSMSTSTGGVQGFFGRNGTASNGSRETAEEMCEIVNYWDDEEMILVVNSHVLDYVKHSWGFIPLQFVKNNNHPTEPWGTSDIENKIDAQIEFNEASSYVSDILRNDTVPHIFGANIDLSEFKVGVAQVHDLGDEAQLFPSPFRAATAPIESYVRSMYQAMIQLGGENEVLYGGGTTKDATGRALSVLMQSVNNRVRTREKRWAIAIQGLVANIFKLVEIYVPNGKQLIQGKYRSDIFFPGSVLRNVTEEINKFNGKVQSLATTMKNIGIASPSHEKKLMKKEFEDARLMIEISRQPQLQMQLTQQEEQAKQAEAAAQQQPQGGAGMVGNGQPSNNAPQMTEGQNVPGEQPASAAGVPVRSGGVSSAGALAQALQNANPNG